MRPAHLVTVLDKEFLSVHDGHHTPVRVCSIEFQGIYSCGYLL